MGCSEPTTKKELLKERNKSLPTKTLSKKDVDDPELVGSVVKDTQSEEIAIPLDFGEDWATFWRKLEKLVCVSSLSLSLSRARVRASLQWQQPLFLQ